MHSQEVTIINKLGLHARASAKLTQTASRFASQIYLTRQGQKVNAKSIMGVMMLAAPLGSQILIEIEGPDEVEAMQTLVALIADYFGEGH